MHCRSALLRSAARLTPTAPPPACALTGRAPARPRLRWGGRPCRCPSSIYRTGASCGCCTCTRRWRTLRAWRCRCRRGRRPGTPPGTPPPGCACARPWPRSRTAGWARRAQSRRTRATGSALPRPGARRPRPRSQAAAAALQTQRRSVRVLARALRQRPLQPRTTQLSSRVQWASRSLQEHGMQLSQGRRPTVLAALAPRPRRQRCSGGRLRRGSGTAGAARGRAGASRWLRWPRPRRYAGGRRRSRRPPARARRAAATWMRRLQADRCMRAEVQWRTVATRQNWWRHAYAHGVCVCTSVFILCGDLLAAPVKLL